VSCPDDHLIYFRFLGRLLGRALFDQQLVKGHMARHIYKHLLGWPITFEDLEMQDEAYYNSLKKLTTMEDVAAMCFDFTVTEDSLGARRDVELIPGGNLKEVTADNLPQYLEANLKYRMLDRVKEQTTELLLGFYDVIPEPALTVFDANEMELILCGLPTIDMDDWINNTIYQGYFETKGRRDKVVEWFWDVVRNEFDQEMKARLLQFVTGTSGVPTRGFSVLQGNEGNIKKFCVNGVSRDHYIYPRAHTCFNRIDLPNYTSKKELYEKLKAAITMSGIGFDME
jgi:HECT-domain (ubiquitin-transferase)